jgi:phage terminase Nu1 subunit (DNA packaging protein)
VVSEVEDLAVIKAGEDYDDWQDCTCADPDEGGYCWYYLTDEEQMDQRVKNVADRLELDEAEVRRVLVQDRL